jgi:hypothetical protein
MVCLRNICINTLHKGDSIFTYYNNNQLLISKAILQECKCTNKNLGMAWSDYQKAFDRVPHSWIIKSLELIGINNKDISFTKKVMPYWRTRMCLHAEHKLTQTEDIKIECGIFQEDSLSPLLFCICLIPLIEQLNRLNTGYEEHTTKTKISHLLYMDYLKLMAKSEENFRDRYKQLKPSAMTFIWNLDLKNVLRLHLREANSFARKI